MKKTCAHIKKRADGGGAAGKAKNFSVDKNRQKWYYEYRLQTEEALKI